MITSTRVTTRTAAVFVIVGGFAACVETASAQPQLQVRAFCGRTWSNDFTPDLGNAPSGRVYSLQPWDSDGSGPIAEQLYATGVFETAGGVQTNGVGAWNGIAWTPLAAGLDGTGVALSVFDDGSGEALYCGGDFDSAAGQPSHNIARWDGSSWSPLAGGVSDSEYSIVRTMLPVSRAGGPKLLVGGAFDMAGNTPANNIAEWDGVTWSALGSGMPDECHALALYDDGSGPVVYAGTLNDPNGNPAGVLRWDGAAWRAVGTDLLGVSHDLAVHDGRLYAGGQLWLREGATYKRYNVVAWDGLSWMPVGAGLNGQGVLDLHVFDSGRGDSIYATGWFTASDTQTARHLARFDGTDWRPVGGGLNDDGWALADYRGDLFVGGAFTLAGNIPSDYIAAWTCLRRRGDIAELP